MGVGWFLLAEVGALGMRCLAHQYLLAVAEFDVVECCVRLRWGHGLRHAVNHISKEINRLRQRFLLTYNLSIQPINRLHLRIIYRLTIQLPIIIRMPNQPIILKLIVLEIHVRLDQQAI